MKKPNQTKTLTQQGAFRLDRNALNRAEKKGITDGEIINKMAETHSRPNSAQAFAEASGAIIHVRANMHREAPIYDAVEAILKENPQLEGTEQPT